MKKNECEYLVYISPDGNTSPCRVRNNDTYHQLKNLVDGEPRIYYPFQGGKYIFVAAEESVACANYIASLFLGERGRYIRGGAVLCMIGERGEYVGFEKKVAQHIAGVMNLLE